MRNIIRRALVLFTVLLVRSAGAVDVKSAEDVVVWLEAESFLDAGGWSNDSQFVDAMGSPYLLATGTGRAVTDAVTRVKISADGSYQLWVRCKDWLPKFSPGKFQVLVGGKTSEMVFGKSDSDAWRWVDGGAFALKAGDVEIRLHDLTGWWGRCDAVVLAGGKFVPADELKALAEQREKHGGVSARVEDIAQHDVVVVGGGLAGCGAAVSAARHGCRVVLIQDRPVLGGNASDEIKIPVEGDRSGGAFNPFDTGVIEEFYPEMRDSGKSKHLEEIVRREKRIDLHLDTRATGVEMKDAGTISSVLALNVRTGRRLRFSAPVFIDCTGHGWVGFWAGAEYRVGEDARSEYNEPSAPEKATPRTMGNNLYDAGFRNSDKAAGFTAPEWAYHWGNPEAFEPAASHKRLEAGRPSNYDQPSKGTGRRPVDADPNGGVGQRWQVEYGGVVDTIKDAEHIRDELFRINIGLWDYAKNHNPRVREVNDKRELAWLSYVMGSRESRRLIGDYVLTENDFINKTVHPDTITYSGWGMDIHHPEGFWVRGNDCMHYYRNTQVSIPFRSLYSKNIGNLMMAGRCHSASHLGMGGTRIMRTCCEMGEAAGAAAALCGKYKTLPRALCKEHIGELQQVLLKDGCYIIGVPNSDPADLARKATATASSAASAGFGKGSFDAGNVNNGWNRAVDKDRNAWVPDLKNAKLPQWVELDLPAAAEINSLHVSFQARRHRGVDFAVEVNEGGQWRRVSSVTGNTARRRVLSFERVKTDKVRLVLEKVEGQVGVCEIRLYDEEKGD